MEKKSLFYVPFTFHILLLTKSDFIFRIYSSIHSSRFYHLLYVKHQEQKEKNMYSFKKKVVDPLWHYEKRYDAKSYISIKEEQLRLRVK